MAKKRTKQNEKILQQRFNFALGEYRGSSTRETFLSCLYLLTECLPYFDESLFVILDEHIDILCSMYFLSGPSVIDTEILWLLKRFCPHLADKWCYLAKSMELRLQKIVTSKYERPLFMCFSDHITSSFSVGDKRSLRRVMSYPKLWTDLPIWKDLNVKKTGKAWAPHKYIVQSFYDSVENHKQKILKDTDHASCVFNGIPPYKYEDAWDFHKLFDRAFAAYNGSERCQTKTPYDNNVFIFKDCQRDKLFALGLTCDSEYPLYRKSLPLLWTNSYEFLQNMKSDYQKWLDVSKVGTFARYHDFEDDALTFIEKYQPFVLETDQHLPYPVYRHSPDFYDFNFYEREMRYDSGMKMMLLDNSLDQEEADRLIFAD